MAPLQLSYWYEMVFLNPNGGGIALFTTTRIAYSNDNETINTNLFDYAVGSDEDGKRYALGTIIQKTKNSTGNNTYKMNFTLLGDPALPLSYPGLKIVTDSINGIKADGYSQPLEAMSTNTLSGSIRNGQGEIVAGFNGSATIIVYDKMLNLKTLGNESSPYTYRSFKNIIYKGNVKVVNGRFNVKFIIPKDIRYNVGNGRISYYAVDDEGVRDAAGVNNTILIGGINESDIKDKSGPDIKLWLNNEWFSNGQTTSSTPLLIARLSDESGINTTGIGVGHDISLFIDGNRANPIILNEFFESDITNPGKGVIYYQIPVLSPGSHTIELRAWDILNNSSVASINFMVDNKMDIKIVAPEIFPNPVTKGIDEITLRLTHDDYDAILSFDIEISNLSGQVLLSKSQSVKSEGLMLPDIKIDTRRLGSGLYLVRVGVTSNSGRTASFSKKIVVVK